jgi:drug/metabolite transporter (DMT)-like permease
MSNRTIEQEKHVSSSPKHRPGRYVISVAFAVLAIALMSTSGLIVRYFASVDAFQINGIRGLAMALSLGLAILLRDGTKVFWKPGRIPLHAALVTSAIYATSTTLFIVSLRTTTVAHASGIAACAPVFAAGLARLLLGERLTTATSGALVTALGGLGIISYSTVINGAGTLVGDGLALVVAVLFGAQTVVIRYFRAFDLLPGFCLGGLLSFCVNTIIGGQEGVSGETFAQLFFIGALVHSLPWIMYVHAARGLPAIQLGLASLLDVPLQPIWVWLFNGETPSATTWLGSALIVVGIAMALVCRALMQKLPHREAIGQNRWGQAECE